MNDSLLEDIRIAIGLSKDVVDFDTEIIMHINSALVELHQNGVINPVVVKDATQTWDDLQDPLKLEGNKDFHMVPLFIALSTKLLFDPPPPSAVETYSKNIDKLLWRLKIAYEEPTTTTKTVY